MLPTPLLLFLMTALFSWSVHAAALIAWHDPVEIARGPGEKGPWEQNDSRYCYVDDPAVAIDRDGGVAVAWVDQARKDIFFQRLSPQGQAQSPQALNVSRNDSTFSWLPRLIRAADAPEKIYILWQEIIFSGGSHGGDILFARSDDNGRSFSQPINLSRSRGGDGKGRINDTVWHNGSLDLAVGPDGDLYAAWTEYEGALWFSRSEDGGKRFSPPQRLVGGEGDKPARAPSLAVGKDQRVYLAWTTGEDEGADIHVAVSSDRGKTFGRPILVAPNDRYADAPKLAAGPDGVLHLVYAQSDGGPFARFRIHYARSTDGGRTFEPPRAVSIPLPASADSAHYPHLAVDAAGRVVVAYELYPDHRREPLGLGISMSVDGGRSFSEPEEVPHSADPAGGTNGSHQGRLMEKLAVNDDGGVAIANSSMVQGRQSRVWLIRGEMKAASAR